MHTLNSEVHHELRSQRAQREDDKRPNAHCQGEEDAQSKLTSALVRVTFHTIDSSSVAARNALTASSRSARLCSAEIWTRIRASPRGTTG